MKKAKEPTSTPKKTATRQKDAHPDARGFVQNNPDASGFAPGKQSDKTDGLWHSSYPDSHGWNHSSIK